MPNQSVINKIILSLTLILLANCSIVSDNGFVKQANESVSDKEVAEGSETDGEISESESNDEVVENAGTVEESGVEVDKIDTLGDDAQVVLDDGNIEGGEVGEDESGGKVDDQSGKSWTYPSSLEDHISTTGFDAEDAQIAMDDDGNAIVVWSQTEGESSFIYMSEYRDGTWSIPVNLDDPYPADGTQVFVYAMNPQVAMDNNGNAIIVWAQRGAIGKSSDGNYENWYSRIFKYEYRELDGSKQWIKPTNWQDYDVDGNDENYRYYPRVAMDDNYNAIIVWYEVDGTNFRIFKSEYRNGGWNQPNSTEFISPNYSESSTKQKALYPQVAMDNNGNAIIAWYQRSTKNYRIYKSEYRNGTWDHPDSINDFISPDYGKANNFDLKMSDGGDAIIVWSQFDGNYYNIYKSHYNQFGWDHPDSISDFITYGSMNAYIPQVAINNNGDICVVTKEVLNDSTNNANMYRIEYRDGLWLSQSSIGDGNFLDNSDTRVDVAMDNNGDSVIAWSGHDGSNYQIFKKEYRDGSWSSLDDPKTDNITSDGQDAYNPQIAMSDNGSAIIVWQQSDGSNTQIFKSEYR